MMATRFLLLLVAFLAALMPISSVAQNVTPSTTNPGYLLVVGKTTDRAKIGVYAAALPPIYADNNAYYLAIGGAGRGVTSLEGPWADRSIIFAKFPSRAQIDAFWWGEDYRAAIRKRDNAGVFSVVALESLAPTLLEGPGTGYLIVMTAPKDASPAQVRLSNRAAIALRDSVARSGGSLLTSTDAGQFTSMEGDTLFDRFVIAAWPNVAARDAYVSSQAARKIARLRGRLGISVVFSANGVPRAQRPPAAPQ
jgi:uncharacterized protein (DUF1330 family)